MTVLRMISMGLGVLVMGGTALAQPAPPPAPPPPPPGGGTGYVAGPAAEPKMRVDLALIAGLPQSDISEADTSPGIGATFGYTVAPNISVGVGARYFSVQGGPDGVDISNYDLGVSVRYSVPISPTAKGFGEAMLLYSTFGASANGQSQSESGVGFGARGGAMFAVSGATSIGGALSYSTASISSNGASADVAWLGVEGFVSFGF